LYELRILRRTFASASVHCWSPLHMMAAFNVRCKRSTRRLAAGGGRLSWRAGFNTSLSGSGRVATRIHVPDLRATGTGYPAGNEGACHGLCCDVRDWSCFWPARETVDRNAAVPVACRCWERAP
jgi:hypothetical protein